MAAKKVIVKICLDTGETQIEAIGYNGQGCKEATASLERALGDVTNRTAKPTMYSNAVETQGRLENRS